jgi:serine/threonine protein kinase
MIGQLLTGRYLILEKLGAGGFSETYLARDKYLPKHPLCVVKCLKLPAHSTIRLETARRLFETEAHLLEPLGKYHPQIPTLFAYCQEQDSTYLVQEYVEGENLSTWLTKGKGKGKRFTVDAAVTLMLELLPILDYIHTNQVIHCDITPSNIIRRRRDSKVVLIDFGASYHCSESTSTSQDAESSLLEIGTPGYMPEEQRLGKPQPSSDLYALGILVIHLLTKVDPRQFKTDLISGELDWQSYLKPSSIPANLVRILDRMVRSRSSDRYQKASEVLEDLKEWKASHHGQAGGSRWQTWANQMLLPASAVFLVGAAIAQVPHLKTVYGPQAKTAIHRIQQKLSPPTDVNLTMRKEIPIESGIARLLIAPNKQFMVSVGANQRHMHLWSLPKGNMTGTLEGSKAPITTLAISPNSNFLVSGREDGTLQVWDATSGKLLQEFKGHQKSVIATAISPDLRILISTSKDRTLYQWNLQTGALLKTIQLKTPDFPQADVTAITYAAASNKLITATRNGQLQVWTLNDWKIQRTFSGHKGTIAGLQLVNDHMLVSFGEDRGLLWDLKSESIVQVLPEASADSIMVSKCTRNIMTVHRDGSIRAWIPENGRLVMRDAGRLDNPKNVAFSPNHDYLVNWNADKRLRFWQINGGDVN